jgi:hypothetical protein
VITDVPVCVALATEVAVTVTVCAELVAAGRVIVAELVVVFDRVPAFVLQVTPAAFLSLVTDAVKASESVPSTVAVDGDTVTGPTAGDELPPQPAVDNTDNKDVTIARPNSARIPKRISSPKKLAHFMWKQL